MVESPSVKLEKNVRTLSAVRLKKPLKRETVRLGAVLIPATKERPKRMSGDGGI